MDDLDRLAFRVARTVRTTYPQLLEHGFSLADLEEKLAPYLETRRELAVGGPNGYEHTVLRLLSGERGYLAAEAELQQACRRALQLPSPSVSIVRTWARSALMLRSGAFALVGTGAPPAPDAAPTTHVTDSTAHGASSASCGCHFCGGRLPNAREARFCPHCGLDLLMRQCPACSTELERHWRFCVTCGRQADDDLAIAPGGATVGEPSSERALPTAVEPLVAAGLFS